MKKRLSSLILVFCLIASIMPTGAFAAAQSEGGEQASAEFQDVSKSDWYYEYIKYAVENGIFNGTVEGTFSPDGTMTRGMYVTVLGRIAGIQTSAYAYSGVFSDVTKDAYYAPYIAWATENHIAEGVGNGSFDPNGFVTREQMAVFTVRFFDVLGIETGESDETGEDPKDLAEVSDWAKDAVLRLWRAGILKGDENGSFNPQDSANRAEGAAISMRVHQTAEAWREEHPPAVPVTADDSETVSSCTVSFESNGGTELHAMTVSRGGAISNLPTPQKMGFVFLGWYTDPSFTTEFTSGTAVNSSLTLYAKYAELESATSMQDERFALTDQATTLSFTLLSSASVTQSEVHDAITLERADGSVAENLLVTDGVGDSYSVSADGGFTAGAAYTLTLSDDHLTFSGREENVRVCAFTIEQEEADDLPLSSGIVYIPAGELSDIIKNGESVASLSVPLVSDEEITEITGTFTYGGSETLAIGDALCVYTGDSPPDADADSSELLSQDIAYVEVSGIAGTTVSYIQASAENVLSLPDMLPIYVGDGSMFADYSPAGTSFTADWEDIDFSQYADLGLDGRTTIDIGDYLCFYSNPVFSETTESDFLGYAVVTDIIPHNGGAAITVTYDMVTLEEMQSGMGYYARTPVSGETLLEDTNVAQLEESLELQAIDSGFAGEAALYLCAVTMATDGFEETSGESLDLSAVGTLSSDSVSLMSFADEIQVDVSASIGTNTQKIGRSGVRAQITVSFEAPVSVGEGEVVISGSATFIQELSVSLDVSGNAVWDGWFIFWWIKDYNIYSYTNVYNYTGMFIDVRLNSQGGGVSFDVSDEIQELLTSTDSAEIVSGLNELLDTYCDLLGGGADWIDLFSQNLFDQRVSILFGIIQLKISGDFVVSAYVNVALGTSFEYSSGTCYAFYGGIFSRNFRSYTQNLADEVFTFRFYVLGELGIRAGIRIELAVGLFSCDFNSVGFTAEAGVYAKLYGYFYYEYREINDVSSTLSTGTLYFELGIYLEINFVAQVFSGSVSASWTLYENEWPLLSAGTRYSVVDFISQDTPEIRLKYENTSFKLPGSFLSMKYLDLREGVYAERLYPVSDYTVTFSSDAFSLSGDNVVVTPGEGDRRLSSDMTITWNHGAMAFSSLPIQRTYHIQWDNLDDGGYRISFEPNGGSYVSVISALYEEPVSAPTPPSQSGYDFGGWCSDAALTTPYTFSTMPAENITLYAKWTPSANTAYTVRHYKQDIANESSYTLADTERLTGTTGSSVTPGVKTYEGFTSPSLQTVTIAPDGSSTVSYYYIRNTYTARFIAEGNESGNADASLQIKYGARISFPSIMRSGYTLDYWEVGSPDSTPDTIPATMPANDLTFTAVWKFASYTIRFDSLGGSSCERKTVTYQSAYGDLPTPTWEGYTFTGWYRATSYDQILNRAVAAGSSVDSGMLMTTPGNHTLYAGWLKIGFADFTVEHYLKNYVGGEYTLQNSYTYSGSIGGEYTAPVKSYAGYSTPDSQTVTVTEGGSSVVKYYYNSRKFTVYLRNDESGEAEVHSVLYCGEAIPNPENPVKTGYIFTGWSPAVPNAMPAWDIISTAQWQKKTYTLALSAPDATTAGSTSATVEYEGTRTSFITNPRRTGYRFTGWYTEGGLLLIDSYGNFNFAEGTLSYFNGNDGTPKWIYDGNITLNAGWEASSGVASYAELLAALAEASEDPIDVAQTITIPGGAEIDGNGRTINNQAYADVDLLDPIFEFEGGATIRNLTIVSDVDGGELTPQDDITLENVTIEGATLMLNGGGTLTDCTFTGSKMALWIGGTTLMRNCAVDRTHEESSASLQVSNASLVMENCSVTNGGGHGIYTYESTLLMNNCTITGNGNSGLYDYGSSSITVLNATIACNRIFGCRIGSGTTAAFVNSILTETLFNNADLELETGDETVTLINCVYGICREEQLTMQNCKTLGSSILFGSYVYRNPDLTQLPDGTWAAPLASDSIALTGGCETYFSAENGTAAYGDTPTYIAGDTGAERVTTYQGGGTRMNGVMGAYGTGD